MLRVRNAGPKLLFASQGYGELRSRLKRMSTTTSTRNNGRSLNLFLGIALAVILIVVLILPPIDLFSRVSNRGMESIAEATSGDVQDPDGTQVAFPAYGVPGSFKASLNSVPQERFLQGTGGDAARAAAEALPESLLPRSPLYDLAVEGQQLPLASLLTIPIPNESEPYRTLDLYEWTGDQWRFLPNHESRDDDKVYSELSYVPAAFMVMQTYASPPTAAALLPVGEQLPDAGRDALTEISPYGYSLSGDGSIEGSVAAQASAGGSYGVAPVLRNWSDDGVVRTDLLDNLLISPENQANHLESIRALVVGNNYPGIEIDYRGLDPTLGPEFTAMVTQLADMLHENNKTLALRVEAPTQVAEDRWTTGGYDWRALSQAVDTFRIPALLDPAAYAPDGKMDALLDWAVGEAPREQDRSGVPRQQRGEGRRIPDHTGLRRRAGAAAGRRPDQPARPGAWRAHRRQPVQRTADRQSDLRRSDRHVHLQLP